MTEKACSYETAIQEAVRTGAWTTELEDHRAGCRSCRETVWILRALGDLSTEAAVSAPAPPPSQGLWLRARSARRSRKRLRQKIVQVLLPAGMGGLTLVGVLIWLTDGAVPFLSRDLATTLAGLSMTGGGSMPLAVPLGLVALAFVLAEDLLNTPSPC